MTDLLDNSVFIFVGLAIGLAAGWSLAARRLGRQKRQAVAAAEQQEREARQELAKARAESDQRIAALRADETQLRRQLERSAARIEQLADDAREQAREQDRAEARIFDRESTIDSLRAKLFASRNTARGLEGELEIARNELELLKQHFNESHAAEPIEITQDDVLSSIVVDLGETLSIDKD